MNVPFFIILAIDVITIITKTEASRWRWNGKSKHKHWNQHRSETNHICSSGQCVLAWKCPEDAIARESTGSCTYWTNGPWVCCDITKIQSQWTSNPSTEALGGYSKQTAATNSWKQTTTTESSRHDSKKHLTTPRIEGHWNRNARERPISSVGNIPGNAQDKFITPRPVYNPTKVPLNGVRKTTADISNKRTTPIPFGTRTTRNKTRIIFPTESIGWTQKVTKRPAFNTQSSRTTKAPDNKSTKTWPTRPTTKVAWRPTTKHPGTTKVVWRPTTKHPGTTKVVWRPTTRLPARTVSTSSRQPTVPTRNWVDSGERRNQGKTTTTPTHHVQSHTTNSRTPNRPSSPRTTVRTTTKYRITTPLPNVNIHMCGIRDQRPATNRRGRSYNLDYGPAVEVEVIYSETKGRQPYQRIVGGEEAEPFSWPWVAALYKVASSGGHRFLSAGSLINEKFVLTAAHLFTPDDLRTASYVVMLGTHDAQDAVAEYHVASVLLYPDYEHRYYYHDIALLRLENPVAFNDYVMPVCLPSPNAPLLRDRDLQGKNVTVMGWGDESFGGKSSRVLREATFPIVSRSSCNASYVRVASNRFPRGIIEEMLCAGDPNGGKDACQGDSGGPLTSIERGRYTQVGIVSFGYQCGDKDYPGVYTKVAPYLSWIAENTRSTQDYNYDYDYRG